METAGPGVQTAQPCSPLSERQEKSGSPHHLQCPLETLKCPQILGQAIINPLQSLLASCPTVAFPGLAFVPYSLPLSWLNPGTHPMPEVPALATQPALGFACHSSLANIQFILWNIQFSSQCQTRRDRQKQETTKKQKRSSKWCYSRWNHLNWALPIEAMVPLKKKLLQISQQFAVKPLKYQNWHGWGQGAGERCPCCVPIPGTKPETGMCKKIIPVLQSLMKNMPEVTFVTVSHTCLVVFTGRDDTSNLPVKPEPWCVIWAQTALYGLWERSQQATINSITERRLGPASSKQDCNSQNTTGFQVFPP